MSWLSPVSWAKWTWTAVRGGEEDGIEEELENSEQRGGRRGEGDDGDDEEERSQGCRQVSRGPGELAVSPHRGGSPVYVRLPSGARCRAAPTRLAGAAVVFASAAPRWLARSHARISVAGSAQGDTSFSLRVRAQPVSKTPECARVCPCPRGPRRTFPPRAAFLWRSN